MSHDALVLGQRVPPIGNSLANEIFQNLYDREASRPVSVAEHGALGDGVTDDTLAFQTALNACVENELALFVPAGTFMVEEISNSLITRLAIVGAGSAVTVIKRLPGLISMDDTQSRMLLLENAAAGGASLSISGLTFDGNGREQGEVDNPFDFQQSHSLLIRAIGVRGFESVQIDDIVVIDSVADGIAISGAIDRTFSTVNISNIQGRDRTFDRSDITVTACWDELNISNVSVDSLEVETNAIETSHKYVFNLANVACRLRLDLYLKGATAAGVRAPANLVNIYADVDEFVLREWDATLSNFHIRTAAAWHLFGGSYKVSNGRFIARSDFTESVRRAMLYAGANVAAPNWVEFENVRFEIEDGAADLIAVYNQANVELPAPDTQRYTFRRCGFPEGSIHTARLGSGRFEYIDCEHGYDGTNADTSITEAIYYSTTPSQVGVVNEFRSVNNRLTGGATALHKNTGAGNPIILYQNDPETSLLARTETNGFAIDFRSGAMEVRDTTTNANVFRGLVGSKATVTGTLARTSDGSAISATNYLRLAIAAWPYNLNAITIAGIVVMDTASDATARNVYEIDGGGNDRLTLLFPAASDKLRFSIGTGATAVSLTSTTGATAGVPLSFVAVAGPFGAFLVINGVKEPTSAEILAANATPAAHSGIGSDTSADAGFANSLPLLGKLRYLVVLPRAVTEASALAGPPFF